MWDSLGCCGRGYATEPVNATHACRFQFCHPGPQWKHLVTAHRNALFHFLRVGQRPHATRFFITGLCLVLDLCPRAEPGTGFGITEVLGTLLFAEATEASQLFDNQHFCVRAHNEYQLWRVLLLRKSLWEDVAIGADLHPSSTLAFGEGIESSFPVPCAVASGSWITSKACRTSHSDLSGAFA